jgi:hypothetical protein
MLTRDCLCAALFITFSACRSSTPPATQTPSAPPPTSAAPDAPNTAAPAPAADPRRDAVLAAWRASNPNATDAPSVLAGPIDYTDESVPGARVAAVVVGGSSSLALVVTAVPFSAESLATGTVSLLGDAQNAIASMSARDVNGDHHPDVAVFLRNEQVLENYVPLQRLAYFYTLQTQPERSMAPMVRSTVHLLGVRDDAALAAALPSLQAYEPPSPGLSPARFIARLRYATPAQFREAVAPSGLRLCTDMPDRTGNRRKRCTTYPVARLTDALITGRIRHDLGQFVDVLADDTSELTEPSCQREGQEVHCGANIGGPAGVDWSVVGEGAAMRLIEISPWAESS